VRPAWAMSRRCKSSGNLVTGTRAKRKVTVARPALKEVDSETVSRRTGSGYEAVVPGVSGRESAKLYVTKGHRRRSDGNAGKDIELTRGGLVCARKGDAQAEREVSRGRSSERGGRAGAQLRRARKTLAA
jgi:hypothetical protein